ncbi:MAG: hypothetical protein IPO36_18660 [Anaerolineales bacterium]|nr:hypothetical protein [Anaerolineales bacterium]
MTKALPLKLGIRCEITKGIISLCHPSRQTSCGHGFIGKCLKLLLKPKGWQFLPQRERNLRRLAVPQADEELRKRKKGEFDMPIAVGGDGSVLRAGFICALPAVCRSRESWQAGLFDPDRSQRMGEYFAKLFNGEAWIESRMMLRAEHIRG